jgi:hypothetical protein
MRFGTWNVKSTYRAGSLRVVEKEISKYKLDLVGVQKPSGHAEAHLGKHGD